MPTAVDLVTDLPADFEVFGQAVATSMADLLGGTTGQILSKTSNTDMDFTWINNDQGDITGVTAGTGISGGGTSGTVTVTNSMATAIDAKGDLIGGTGADTFARLAVGANGTVLTADSAEATGLKWAAPSSGSLVYITGASPSGSSAVNINNCFTSTYQNYLIVFNLLGSTGTNLSMRLRNSGTDVTASNYSYFGQSIQPNGTSGAWYNANGSKWDVNDLSTVKTTGTITIMNPQETNYTTAQVNTTRLTNGTTGRFITQGFTNNASLSSDGFSIFPDSGTCTGTVRVYGITNS